MAGNYAQLLDIINNPTQHGLPAWDNNSKQIEGETVQQYLLTIINSLTVGYQFKGVATPTTNPGTPDQKVFYLASLPGVYTNFGGLIVEKNCITILLFDENGWRVGATNWREDKSSWFTYVMKDGYMYIDNNNILHWKKCALISTNRFKAIFITDGVHSASDEQSIQLAPRMVLYCNVEYVEGRSQYVVQTEILENGQTPNFVQGLNLLLFAGGSLGNLSQNLLFSDAIKATNDKLLIKQITGFLSFTKNKVTFDNSNLYIQLSEGGPVVSVTVPSGTSFTLSGTERLVLHVPEYEVAKVDSAADILETDIVLLGVINNEFHFGALYPQYLHSLIAPDQRIVLDFEYGSLRASDGAISNFKWDGFIYRRTPRFLRTGSQELIVTAKGNVNFRVLAYDENFAYINVVSYDLVANTPQTIKVTSEYCKFLIATGAEREPTTPVMDIPVEITGRNMQWVYNNRPLDDGYINFIYPINLANASSGDDDTTNVQDNEIIGYDYGLLVLPQSYTRTGKPTRLIIYCHGAGAGIDGTTTRFNANNMLRPEYWLAQGYAIMDVDGNPFDKGMPHWYIPQAYQSYLNAYQWVIRNYNIARDGVFVGGRSMGGGMTLGIINNTNIPVKAAFLIAPNGNFSTFLNVVGAARHTTNPRKFIADYYGCVGTQPTWTLDNPMTTQEWEYFKANYHRLTRYIPFFGFMNNLPDVETMMDDNFRINAMSTTRPVGELDLYETLKAKTHIPIKIFVAQDDDQAVPNRNAQYLLMQLEQGGNICEYRTVPTGGHFSEMNAANQVTITDKMGNTLQNVPIFYIEALQFCRRYEQTTW